MREIFTPEQIAEKLQTSRSTVYRWLRTGELKSFKAGSLWRITRADLESFLGREIPWES